MIVYSEVIEEKILVVEGRWGVGVGGEELTWQWALEKITEGRGASGGGLEKTDLVGWE